MEPAPERRLSFERTRREVDAGVRAEEDAVSDSDTPETDMAEPNCDEVWLM